MKGQVFSDDQATLTYIEQTLQLMALNPVDVPTEWLGLSGLDYIAIPADDAIAMAAQQREGWEAIVAWIHAGGKLVIYRAFEGNEQVQQLRQILDPSRVQGEAPNSESHPKGIFGHLGFGAYCVTLRDGGPIDDESEHDAKQDIQTFFGARNLSDFNVRHGLTLSGSNPGFWNFVIAGVGLPPSGAFLVLISLFVIVLGPVNYFALARRQRLYLLLLTVPLGAGLATLGLFSYALLSDGLGARARVRDFTILDQTTGYAATMSRQAVFAGLAPSGGPTIPRDLAIYPIFPDGRERKRALRIDWSDQKQRLTGGYLSSRSMSQFFFVRSHRTESRLPIQIAADRLSGSAENRLGVKLRDVWAQDAEGNLYAGENGEPGETCILKPVARSVAHGRFLKSWALQNMAPGDDTSRYWSSRSSGWNQRANRPGNQGAGDASASLLERRLLFLQQNFTLPSSATVIDDSGETATNGQIRSDGAREGKWFLAVAESSRETPVLIESAVVADRLHVIEGNW